jgi:ribosome production factor 1
MSLKFAFELKKCIPDAEFLPRKNTAIKRIVKDAIKREYTDLVVVHEDNKKPSKLFIYRLH